MLGVLAAALVAAVPGAQKPAAASCASKDGKATQCEPAQAPAAAPLPASPVGGTPARGTFKFDIPKVVSQVEVPGTTWSNGIPTKMHVVVSTWKEEDLARYVIDSYVKQGLYVPPYEDQVGWMRETFITGLDVDTWMAYTTILQPNKDGSTTCILATANLAAANPELGENLVPLFPGAKNVMRAHLEGSSLIQFEAPAKSDEVVAYYRDVLAKAGYREGEPGHFSRGDEQLQITARPDGSKTQMMVIRKAGPEEWSAPPDVPQKK